MDISKRYSVELNKINNHLTDLERGRIYELTREHPKVCVNLQTDVR